MPRRRFNPHDIERLKRDATKLKKRLRLTHTAALNRLAIAAGYASFEELRLHSVPAAPTRDAVAPASIVRFLLDDKDTVGFSDSDLEARGFARDDAFLEALIHERHGADAWDFPSWDCIRVLHPPSSDPAEVIAHIQETFFFPPDELWIGDQHFRP